MKAILQRCLSASVIADGESAEHSDIIPLLTILALDVWLFWIIVGIWQNGIDRDLFAFFGIVDLDISPDKPTEIIPLPSAEPRERTPRYIPARPHRIHREAPPSRAWHS